MQFIDLPSHPTLHFPPLCLLSGKEVNLQQTIDIMETILNVEAGYCPCQGCVSIIKQTIRDVCKPKGTELISMAIDLEKRFIIVVGHGIDITKLVVKLRKKKPSSKITIQSMGPISHQANTKSPPPSPPSSPEHEDRESSATMEEEPSLRPRRPRVVKFAPPSPPIEPMPLLPRQPNYAPQQPFEYSPYSNNYHEDHYQTHHQDHSYGQMHHYPRNDPPPRDYGYHHEDQSYNMRPIYRNDGPARDHVPTEYQQHYRYHPEDQSYNTRFMNPYGTAGSCYPRNDDPPRYYGSTGYQLQSGYPSEDQSYDAQPIYPSDQAPSCHIM
ncbi:hypothetical protein LINGRAHAP2_LOCUS15207 [Linum grandiflorum]